MALTADRTVEFFTNPEPVEREFPVAAGETIYKGGFVGRNPAGYAKAFEPGDEFLGVSYGQVDCSAETSDGVKNVRTIVEGTFEHALSGVALTDGEQPVYATDDTTLSFTGHPDAYVAKVVHYTRSGYAVFRMRALGEAPPNGVGSITLGLTGHEAFTATGATAGTAIVKDFDIKTILGPGLLMNDAENAGIQLAFDAVAEVALASVRTRNDCLPIDKGLTFDVDLCVTDKGDDAALDIDFGFGTALTTNSEADIDHADMVQLAAFHLNGASDNILAQSDDNTTDVAPVDTTIDNDSTTDVAKHFKIIVRVDGTVEFWIAGARVLSTTSFAMLSTALVSAFINMEKTSNDTEAEIIFTNLVVKAGAAAAA